MDDVFLVDTYIDLTFESAEGLPEIDSVSACRNGMEEGLRAGALAATGLET